MFNNKWAKSLTQKFNAIQASDVANINDSELKSKFLKLKAAKQAGFTLLELLVVVAILAAIAGTASIALQDTDAKASAAAHVAMMDELNKGIRTFRVLNKNTLPNRYDSLLTAAVTGGTSPIAKAAAYPSNELVAIEDVGTLALTADAVDVLKGIGITELQYLDIAASTDFTDSGTPAVAECLDANITATIASRANTVVSNNIFMTPTGNGCGGTVTLAATDLVSVWTGGYERIYGGDGAAFDALGAVTGADGDAGEALTTAYAGQPVLMTVGLGPSSNLFNANTVGGMTTVPSYRHVNELQYGRFIALFEIGTFTGTDAAYTAADQVALVAIVDGAGDTKEEELGEWDGTRSTI
ncbi:MAG: type II secretion system protein [Litorilituus sp.]|nr:type II secretion system protein [Litorilituus sp.]